MLRFKIIMLPFLFMIYNLQASSDLTWSKVHHFGGWNNQGAYDIESDSLGNVYVLGTFYEQIQFDTITLYPSVESNTSASYIAKFDSTGKIIWANVIDFELTRNTIARSMAMDKYFNVYVVGSSYSTESGAFFLNPAFLNCYSKQGDLKWSYEMEERMGWSDFKGKSIVCDGNELWISTQTNTSRYDIDGTGLSWYQEGFDCIAIGENKHLLAAKKNNIYLLDTLLLASIYDSITTLPDNLQILDFYKKDTNIYLTGFVGPAGEQHDMYCANVTLGGEILWSLTSSNLHSFSSAEGVALCEGDSGMVYITGEFNNKVGFGSLNVGEVGMNGIILLMLESSTGELVNILNAYSDGKFDVYGITLNKEHMPLICGEIFNTFTILPTFDDQVLTGIGWGEAFYASIMEPNLVAKVNGQLFYSGNQPYAQIDILKQESDNTISTYKKTITDGAGNFSFKIYNPGNYILRAHVYLQPTTYYNETYTWSLADNIQINSDTTINNLNFSMISCEPLNGSDSITGTLYSYNDILKSYFNVILVNSTEDVVAHTRTDSMGYYFFSNVPAGSYKIVVDSAGIPMDSYHTINTIVKRFEAKSEVSNSYHNRDYLFGSDNVIYKIGDIANSVEDNQVLNDDIWIYPNPCKDLINIYSSVIIESVSIFNALGKLVGVYKVDNNRVDVSSLESGLYFIRIYSKNVTLTRKIIK